MANWWEAAPLVEQENWWEAAPLLDDAEDPAPLSVVEKQPDSAEGVYGLRLEDNPSAQQINAPEAPAVSVGDISTSGIDVPGLDIPSPGQAGRLALSAFQQGSGNIPKFIGGQFRRSETMLAKKAAQVAADPSLMRQMELTGQATLPSGEIFRNPFIVNGPDGMPIDTGNELELFKQLASDYTSGEVSRPNTLENIGQAAIDAAEARISDIPDSVKQSGLGRTVSGIGGIGTMLGGPVLGPISIATQMGQGLIDEARQEIEKDGGKMTLEQEQAAAYFGLALAPTQMIPIARVFGRVEKLGKGIFSKEINASIKKLGANPSKTAIKTALASGVDNAIGNVVEQFGHNVFIKDVIGLDEARSYLEGFRETAIDGLTVGGFLGLVMGAAGHYDANKMASNKADEGLVNAFTGEQITADMVNGLVSKGYVEPNADGTVPTRENGEISLTEEGEKRLVKLFNDEASDRYKIDPDAHIEGLRLDEAWDIDDVSRTLFDTDGSTRPIIGTQSSATDEQIADPDDQSAAPPQSEAIPKLKTPEDIERSNAADSLRRTNEERGLGLTDEQIEAIAAQSKARQEMGWFTARTPEAEGAVLDSAIDVVKSGGSAHEISIDFSNLGGLNAFHNNVAANANRDFEALMGLIKEEIAKIDPDAVYLRTGGDEFKVVAQNGSTKALNEAMERARTRARDYALENGFGNISHAKTGKENFGVDFYFGMRRVKAEDTAEQISQDADRLMGRMKDRLTGEENVGANSNEQVGAGRDGVQGLRQAASGTQQSQGARGLERTPESPVGVGRAGSEASGAQNAGDGRQLVLQNRNRSSVASIDQMNEIASNPDYLRAGQSFTMDQGAPVVFGDTPPSAAIGRPITITDNSGNRNEVRYAVVESSDVITSNHVDGTPNSDYANGAPGKLRAVAGNGRAAGITEGHNRGTTRQYRADLMSDLSDLGIDASQVEAIANPMLVRLMSADDVTADIGDRSNVQAGAQLSAVEQAANDIRRIDTSRIEFDANGLPTRQAAKAFVQAMPVGERNALLNEDGSLSRQGHDRMMAAIFKQAYDNDGLVQLYAQATDPEARTVMTALARVSGKAAQLRGQGGLDLSSLLQDAAIVAVNARRQGRSLSEFSRNADLSIGQDVMLIVDFMANNIRSSKRIAEGLESLLDDALVQAEIIRQNESTLSMFGDQPVKTRQQILEDFSNANRSEADATQQSVRQPRGSERSEEVAQQREPEQERRGISDEDAGARDKAQTEQVVEAPKKAPLLEAARPADIGKKTDGKPYASRHAANAAKNRADLKDKDLELVEVDGGWVLREKFTLEQQTEAEAAEQAEKERKAEESRKRQEQDAEGKRKADSEANDFRLAGSDLPADVAAAGGQMDLLGSSIRSAAQEVDTTPTEAQKEAGNYKKGHVSIQGLDVSIENPKGSTRSGTDARATSGL